MQPHTPSTPTPVQTPALKVKTHLKAGQLPENHNETLVRIPRPAPGLRVKTHGKAGGIIMPD
jgi:hypothetical protein